MEQRFSVPDISCGHCKSAIEGALQPVAGVTDATVDVDARAVTVDYDPNIVGEEDIVSKIGEAGYQVSMT